MTELTGRDPTGQPKAIGVDADGKMFITTAATPSDSPLPVALTRSFSTTSVTIAAGGNLSNAIDFSKMTMMTFRMPAVWTAASIGFKVSASESGVFLPMYDDAGDLVQIDNPLINRSYSSPPALSVAHWVKLWSQNGTGTNTAQGAARTISVDLKS